MLQNAHDALGVQSVHGHRHGAGWRGLHGWRGQWLAIGHRRRCAGGVEGEAVKGGLPPMPQSTRVCTGLSFRVRGERER
jgi:hypothetical protein